MRTYLTAAACLLLSALVNAQTPAQAGGPLTEAYSFFVKGRTERAINILDAQPGDTHRTRFLRSEILLREGHIEKALSSLEALREPLTPESSLCTWVKLLEAEAQLRSGSSGKAAEQVEALLKNAHGNRTIKERGLHLLLMHEMAGDEPDEPTGLAPLKAPFELSIGAGLLPALGLDEDPAFQESLTSQISSNRSSYEEATKLFLNRLPKAPIRTLIENSKEAKFILLAWLGKKHTGKGGLVEKGFLPLFKKHVPGKILVALILSAPDRKDFQTLAREVRGYSKSTAKALILWSKSETPFLHYGITRPPFFLLVPRKYKEGISDWEPPWGNARLFIKRLLEDLSAGRNS